MHTRKTIESVTGAEGNPVSDNLRGFPILDDWLWQDLTCSSGVLGNFNGDHS